MGGALAGPVYQRAQTRSTALQIGLRNLLTQKKVLVVGLLTTD